MMHMLQYIMANPFLSTQNIFDKIKKTPSTKNPVNAEINKQEYKSIDVHRLQFQKINSIQATSTTNSHKTNLYNLGHANSYKTPIPQQKYPWSKKATSMNQNSLASITSSTLQEFKTQTIENLHQQQFPISPLSKTRKNFSKKLSNSLQKQQQFMDIKSFDKELTQCLANSMHREQISKLLGFDLNYQNNSQYIKSTAQQTKPRSNSEIPAYDRGTFGKIPAQQTYSRGTFGQVNPDIKNSIKPSDKYNTSPILKFNIDDEQEFNFNQLSEEEDSVSNESIQIQNAITKQYRATSQLDQQQSLPTFEVKNGEEEFIKLDLKANLKHKLEQKSFPSKDSRIILTINEKIKVKKYILTQ